MDEKCNFCSNAMLTFSYIFIISVLFLVLLTNFRKYFLNCDLALFSEDLSAVVQYMDVDYNSNKHDDSQVLVRTLPNLR